jgi:hypothetical protein
MRTNRHDEANSCCLQFREGENDGANILHLPNICTTLKLISKVGLNVRTHARTQLTRCRRRKASSPKSAMYVSYHLLVAALLCESRKGVNLGVGAVTALAASHFSCCILCSRYQPAQSACCRRRLSRCLMTTRTGWLENGRETGIFFGRGGSCFCPSRDVNALSVRCHILI